MNLKASIAAGAALLSIGTASAQPLTMHTIQDTFGFDRPLDAYSVGVPAGWTLNGTITWDGNPRCMMEPSKLHFMATSEDGKRRIEHIPGGVWGWTSMHEAGHPAAGRDFSGCPARPIGDAQTFMAQYVPAIRPGAQVVSMRPRPDLVQVAWDKVDPKDMEQMPPNARMRLEIVDVHIRYDSAGTPVEEILLAPVLFVDQPGPNPYTGMMDGYVTVGMSMGTLAQARVGGVPDRALLNRVMEAMDIDRSYVARVKGVMDNRLDLMRQASARKRAAQQAWLASRQRGAASSSSGWTVDTSGSDILDIQMGTYKSTSAMQDAGRRQIVDMVQERTPYTNVGGQTVYMPNGYRQVYQLPNQVYVGTHDTFFNPVGATGQFGEQLQPAPY